MGGTLLATVAVAGGPWLLLCGARGRWLGWVPRSIAAAWVASAILLITLIDWGVRLATG